MGKICIVTIDEEFEKSRTLGAKDIKKRRRSGKVGYYTVPGYTTESGKPLLFPEGSPREGKPGKWAKEIIGGKEHFFPRDAEARKYIADKKKKHKQFGFD
jgi:hypothetical protein